jgi:hypothetical protein
MYRINVVYTGIDVKEIRDLNFKDLTCYMDFFLWIRYQGGDELNKLVFLNSVDPIKIDNSVYKKRLKNKDKKGDAKTEVELLKKRVTKDNLQYYLYHIQGRFRMDFIPGRNVYGEHIVGISFRHPDMDRNNLIYVRDVLGMGKYIYVADHYMGFYILQNDLISGEEELSAPNDLNFAIYPNPASGEFRVLSLPAGMAGSEFRVGGAALQLFGVDGRKLLEKSIPKGSEEISVDVRSLQSGLYFVRVTVDNKSVTKKLIIQK